MMQRCLSGCGKYGSPDGRPFTKCPKCGGKIGMEPAEAYKLAESDGEAAALCGMQGASGFQMWRRRHRKPALNHLGEHAALVKLGLRQTRLTVEVRSDD